MQILGRLARTAAIAGALLALGVLILIPQARAFTGDWQTARGDVLAQMSELSERSVVLARDGSVIDYLHADENREPIKLAQVPDTVIKAVVGVEDDRFWKHHGIDLRGMFRAFATNVSAGEVRQGGSTLTQQLVKNSLLTPEKTVDRKVREAILAWRIEDHNSKKQILERYLNTVYFGNGAYGVQAAAEVYFGKTAAKLDEADSVLLAGLIRNPVGYDPIAYPDAARQRRRVVVDRLVAEGIMSTAGRERVLARPLPRAVKSLEKKANNEVVDLITQELIADRRLGETKAERYNAIFKGGLRIYTTLDPVLGDAAHQAVDTIVPNTGGKFVAALASVEPSTGAVRAIVGADVDVPGKHRFNLATQSHRQPGSSFKAMVLVAALREGYGPATTVDGTSPCTVKFPDSAPYELENAEGEGGGVMPLTEATADSINCAYVRLASVVGLKKIEEAAHDLGITSDLRVHRKGQDPYLVPAMSIGGLDLGVSPLEMASAYATLANDGVYHKPYYIERVLDRHGKVLFRGASKGEQRVSTQVAREAVSILRGVVTGGTGTKANPGKWPTFGKTGTTQDYTDGWFVGSTRQLTAAVWMGSPIGKVPMRNVGGIKVFGGTYPARVFGQFMRTAMAGRPALLFPPPDPKEIGNKQMKLSPSATTGVRSTTPGDVQVGEPGVTVADGSPPSGGPNQPPDTRPRRPPSSEEPPPTQAPCQEPDNWPDDYPPFCQ